MLYLSCSGCYLGLLMDTHKNLNIIRDHQMNKYSWSYSLVFKKNYGPMSKLCLSVMAINKRKPTFSPYKEHSYQEIISSHMQFVQEDFWNLSQSESIIGPSHNLRRNKNNVRTTQVTCLINYGSNGPVVCEK